MKALPLSGPFCPDLKQLIRRDCRRLNYRLGLVDEQWRQSKIQLVRFRKAELIPFEPRVPARSKRLLESSMTLEAPYHHSDLFADLKDVLRIAWNGAMADCWSCFRVDGVGWCLDDVADTALYGEGANPNRRPTFESRGREATSRAKAPTGLEFLPTEFRTVEELCNCASRGGGIKASLRTIEQLWRRSRSLVHQFDSLVSYFSATSRMTRQRPSEASHAG